MDLLGQSAFLVAMVSFGLGTSVLTRNVKNTLYLAWAVLCACIAAWAFFFFLEKISEEGGFYVFHLFFNLWVAPAAIVFIRFLIRTRNRSSSPLLTISFIGALVLSACLILDMHSNGWIRFLIYFFPALIVVQILLLMWNERSHSKHRARSGGDRKRRRVIYIGAILALCTSVMDHVPLLGHVVPSIGNIALAIYLFFLSQAISQQRLLNFGALFTRFLVLILMAFTLTVFYSLLVAWISDNPALFFLNSFIASFLILMLLDPLRSFVAYFTTRLMTQKQRRLMDRVRDRQMSLTGIIDLEALFHSILSVTDEVLRPEWTGLYVLGADGTRYYRVREAGNREVESLRRVLADHPLLEWCRGLKKRGELPVLLDQILLNEIDRSASRVQREEYVSLIQQLRAMGCNLLIPLFYQQEILGFVAINASSPPEPWGGNWGILRIIYPYYEQATQTLRSMEVYDRQREQARLATMGEMAAGLAHEIRNPLGAIKGAAQFLDPSDDQRPESRFLRVIVEETDRLNRVVSQFLDYSKAQEPEVQVVRMGRLLERSVEKLRPSLESPSRLELKLPSGELKDEVLVESEQIHQVIVNLVQNAIRSIGSQAGGRVVIALEIEEHRNDEAHREVIVNVEDNGPGIPRDQLDKIFIPFFTSAPEGTGLGLSISQKIIRAHQGRIQVHSEPGKLTRFSIILPGHSSSKEIEREP